MHHDFNEFDLDDFLHRALREDLLQSGDITSNAIFSEKDNAHAHIKCKEAGVVSGLYLLKRLFTLINPACVVTIHAADGEKVSQGTLLCELNGPIRAILAGERIALNLLQRLSGIATATNVLVSAISHTLTKVLDTRKTTPLLRCLEKRAVRDGGGQNHRMGLYDMVLIKDTHVAAAGSVGAAIRKARAAVLPTVKIEAEVQSLDEFNEALIELPTIIMLDNMTNEHMRQCVTLRNSQNAPVMLEASGNVTLERIKEIAETGVDYISTGAITHSVKALDIHLVIVP